MQFTAIQGNSEEACPYRKGGNEEKRERDENNMKSMAIVGV
jgi:ribosome modulation factor